MAAGSGQRFGGPKQLASLDHHPLVAWSLVAARSVARGIVLVVPEDVGDDAATAWGLEPEILPDAVVVGGATRAASVRAGLSAVPPHASVIVVHDAARPLAPPSLFHAVVQAVIEGADGAVPTIAVNDTLKRTDGARVTATVDRAGIVAVQTPQAFRADALRRAHADRGEATDDAGLLETLGYTVRAVPGDPCNLKVTTAEDLVVAEALAASTRVRSR